MKFRVEVRGKDAAATDIALAAAAQLSAAGLDHTSPRYEKRFATAERRLAKIVGRYVQGGSGGDDSVTLEFDTESASPPRVVPLKEAKAAGKPPARKKAKS